MMKLWQLLPFVDHRRLLADAEFKARWISVYQWLGDLNRIVDNQERDKLDAEMPEELIVSALSGSNVRFEFSQGRLRCSAIQPARESFSAVEAYRRYGAHAMHEAYEYGSHEIKTAPMPDA